MDYLLTPKLFLWLPLVLVGLYVVIFRAITQRIDEKAYRRRQEAEARALEEASKAVTAKRILTPNEEEFCDRLKKAAEPLGLEVAPQVAMGALLDVNLPQSHPLFWPLRRQFAQKIIDYVIYVKASKDVLCVVELDDCTHDKEKDKKRDELMARAGFKTVRCESKQKPSVAKLQELFKDLQAQVQA